MKSPLLRFLGFVVSLSVMPAVQAAGSDAAAIVAKARAYAGPESALNSLKSIHMVGDLVTILDTSAPDAKPIKASVDIVYQAANKLVYQNKITAVSDAGTEVTSLDGFTAWHRVEDKSTPPKWNLTQQSVADVKRLRANTIEQLSFFKGVDPSDIQDLGTVTVGGVICHKLSVRHSPDIVFYKYIDQVTGRLVQTETGEGGSVREEGEIRAGGIRFPQKTVTTVKTANGKTATVTVTISKITVNEAFPDSFFTIPAFSVK